MAVNAAHSLSSLVPPALIKLCCSRPIDLGIGPWVCHLFVLQIAQRKFLKFDDYNPFLYGIKKSTDQNFSLIQFKNFKIKN